jgi:hypothetical protein
MDDMEFAAVEMAGTPVVRTAALRSFAKAQTALVRAGGRVPFGPDGLPMYWNEYRGWYPRTEGLDSRPIIPLRSPQAIEQNRPAAAWPFDVTKLETPADARRQRLRAAQLDIECDRLRASVDRQRELKRVYGHLVARLGSPILRPSR